MKKIIYLFTLLFLLSSCFNSSDNKTINEEKTIDSNTGVSVNNPLTEDEEITLQISANFEDFLKTLSSIEDVKQNLIKENDGNYLEEVPYIESYYTQNANTDFFILNSIKENNNTICDEISDDKGIKLCKDLFDNSNNEKEFIDIYLEYGESEKFAKSMFLTLDNIEKGSCNGYEKIVPYLRCKKMLDSNFNAMEVFLNYSIIEYEIRYVENNYQNIKQYYKQLTEKWGYDEGFTEALENRLFTSSNQ